MILVTLVLAANWVPAEVVTTSPTFKVAAEGTVNVLVKAFNVPTVCVSWLYLKPL